ncbi:D-ribose-binding periplasmic protein [Perilla frutescens var. frutescens]|nr:D-ribose-binding periplasmic protein [Perilla frutescens var. frutescens]
MYWTITASEVMKMNPGHYVSLIIPLPFPGGGQENPDEQKTVRYTRVKLLRPSDTLVLGRAYRLVTTQEVMKVIRAKKHARSKRNQSESGEHMETNSERCITSSEYEVAEYAPEKNNQARRSDRHKQRSGSTNLAAGRPKSWRPSLQSISEFGS